MYNIYEPDRIQFVTYIYVYSLTQIIVSLTFEIFKQKYTSTVIVIQYLSFEIDGIEKIKISSLTNYLFLPGEIDKNRKLIPH